jgi:hypothetical protein
VIADPGDSLASIKGRLPRKKPPAIFFGMQYFDAQG